MRRKVFCIYECWIKAGFLSLLVVTAYSNIAKAQTQQDLQNAIRQQKQILQQQEQRRSQELEELRKTAAPPGERKKLKDIPKNQSKVCIRVSQIEFEGAELLTKELQKKVKAPYVGKCITVVDILSIARAITNWYIKQGYVTTRAFPPAQDISSGRLLIKVVEGRTEDLTIVENGKPRQNRNTAFPQIVGKRLFIRDIEQGLDQINRLPTHDAKIRILPGTQDGDSKIQVETKKSKWPIVTSTIDDFGGSATGKLRAGVNVRVDDIFGLYDGWTFNHTTSKPFADGKSSEEYSGNVSIPFGYSTFLFSASYFDYLSTIQGAGEAFESSGKSYNYLAEWDYVLHRDQVSKTRFASFINFKENENFIEGVKISNQSRKLNIIGVRLSHSTHFMRGLADFSVSGLWGAPMFGSLKDEDIDVPSGEIKQKAEFTKFKASVKYIKPIKVGTQNFVWNVSAQGQWSPDELYSTEQIGIGGQYSVRGFRDQSVNANTGAYIRNELSWNIPLSIQSKEMKKLLGSAQLFAAYDVGWLKGNEDTLADGAMLSGVAGGIRLSGGMLFGEAVWEKALEAPSILKKDDVFRFQAGIKLHW
ncbi:MAG: ShlB/FhaC/HecB family hemolysin secretion/activation protein [Methyloligellaceae bacterium]